MDWKKARKVLLIHMTLLLTLKPEKMQIHFGGEKQDESQLFIVLSEALAEGQNPVAFL